MSNNELTPTNLPEVNLKRLINKILDKKWLFLASILICTAVAYVFLKLATPIYQVEASILIDPQGQSRNLGGESQYVEGGVDLIETEKNIFNEIGILKSYNLVKETMSELNFEISYFATKDYRTREKYGYYPFEVELLDSMPQLYGGKFFVDLLDQNSFRLRVEAEGFEVSNPQTNTYHVIENNFTFSKVYNYGAEIKHDFFNFIINKPDYKVATEAFQGQELHFEVYSVDDLTSTYLGKLDVAQLDIQASILQMSSTGPVVEKEVQFLEKLSNNYIKSKLEERDQIAISKESFIRNQLLSVSDSLEIAEKKLEVFRRNSQSVNLSLTAANTLDQVQTVQDDKAQNELNIKYYNSLLNYLEEGDGINKIVAPSVVGINDPFLNENLLELKRLNSDKISAEFTKGAKSFDLVILDQQIDNTTNSIKENLRNLVQSSQMSLQEKDQRLSSLNYKINQLPSNEKRLVNFQRKSLLYENLYNYLSQELAKTGIARAEDIPDTKILDSARMIGDGPISPAKTMIMALGFLVGFILPLGFIILQGSLDDTIENVDQLERATQMPIAASIAQVEDSSKKVIKERNDWQLKESFRDLSANLQFLFPDDESKIIGITSTIPGEGKSFCTYNLATSFAKEGKKVLLLDADFRKVTIIEELDKKDRKEGITNYLSNDKISIDAIIHRHKKLKNFHYIPVYDLEENPHRLLSKQKMETLLYELKERFDYVIIDSPAIGLVSDYLLLTKYVDLHLFLIRRKVSKVSFLKDMEKLKRKGKMDNLYVIFNGAKGRTYKYGYSDYEYAGNRKK